MSNIKQLRPEAVGTLGGAGRPRPRRAHWGAAQHWGAADGPAAAILGRKPANVPVAYRIAVCEPGRLTTPKQRGAPVPSRSSSVPAAYAAATIREAALFPQGEKSRLTPNALCLTPNA
ncbi:MAG: hypothetical protein K2G69_05575 [Muribaculaceae bacterium]|nr:hypothetical protein [Muribaculaceae bacterium]